MLNRKRRSRPAESEVGGWRVNSAGGSRLCGDGSASVDRVARSAVFAPLDQLGRAETVARRMADAIAVGLLADQEQLPSESELAEQFGVSTVTVREALMALRQKGLVETRRGRGGGSFVRAPAQASHVAELRERVSAMSLADLRDVGDHYTAVAGTAARLAAERASPEDVARLRAAAAEFDCSESSVHRAERSFHLEVAAASQSPRLTQMEVRLQGEVGALLWLPATQQGTRQQACAEHTAIVSAISEGDGQEARALTEQHVLDVVEGLAELHLRLVAP